MSNFEEPKTNFELLSLEPIAPVEDLEPDTTKDLLREIVELEDLISSIETSSPMTAFHELRKENKTLRDRVKKLIDYKRKYIELQATALTDRAKELLGVLEVRKSELSEWSRELSEKASFLEDKGILDKKLDQAFRDLGAPEDVEPVKIIKHLDREHKRLAQRVTALGGDAEMKAMFDVDFKKVDEEGNMHMSMVCPHCDLENFISFSDMMDTDNLSFCSQCGKGF